MPSAQAAYDAVFDLILNYNHREVTGLGAVSREGKDDRDHLYVFAWSEDPSGPVEEIDELLDDHGRRSNITLPELFEEDGLQLYGYGDGLSLMGFLLWHHPGEIEVRWPERRRQRPDDAVAPHPRNAQSRSLIERIVGSVLGKRSILP